MKLPRLQAQQGNPQAIAICLKAVFPVQPIDAIAQREQDILILQLRTLDTLEKPQAIRFLEQWLVELNPSGINVIEVQVKLQGQDCLAWEQSLRLESNSGKIADTSEPSTIKTDELATDIKF